MEAFPFDSELTFDDHDNPIYDRAVSSQPLRELIRGLFSTGVMPNPSTCLQVSAGTDGMTVQVAAGFAVVDGGLCRETETRTLEVTAADNTYDRIDTVVLRWNENVDVRTADLYVVAGTPAVNPVRPTLQRNNSVYEIGLADVFITKRVATITNDKITDTRYNSTRCGIVSSVSEWDTTTIYQQIQADLAGFKTNEQAGFESWFDTIRGILDGDTAGHLQNEIDELQPVRKRTITNLIDPSKYVINSPLTTHGVTITNNGDGTFTVNGTTDSDVGADNRISINLYPYRADSLVINDISEIKFCGTPSGMNNKASLQLMDANDTDVWYNENTGLIVPTVDGKLTLNVLRLQLYPNTAFDNVVFKPMLTADLNATYDDYVEYSGDGNLNENLAVIKDNLTSASGVPFIFGIDGNGDYGYYKQGETNLTPFKSKHTETYKPTVRANNLDMGLYHKKRYVDTTDVPNTNSGTYTITSNGTHDMGATNTNRYAVVDVKPSVSKAWAIANNYTIETVAGGYYFVAIFEADHFTDFTVVGATVINRSGRVGAMDTGKGGSIELFYLRATSSSVSIYDTPTGAWIFCIAAMRVG